MVSLPLARCIYIQIVLFYQSYDSFRLQTLLGYYYRHYIVDRRLPGRARGDVPGPAASGSGAAWWRFARLGDWYCLRRSCSCCCRRCPSICRWCLFFSICALRSAGLAAGDHAVCAMLGPGVMRSVGMSNSEGGFFAAAIYRGRGGGCYCHPRWSRGGGGGGSGGGGGGGGGGSGGGGGGFTPRSLAFPP